MLKNLESLFKGYMAECTGKSIYNDEDPSAVLEEYFDSLAERRGVHVLNLPTGAGKTYQHFRFVGTCARLKYLYCIYVIPQRKQRDNGYDEFKKCAVKYGVDLNEALVLNGIVDQAESSYENNLYDVLVKQLGCLTGRYDKVAEVGKWADYCYKTIEELKAVLAYRKVNPSAKSVSGGFADNQKVSSLDASLRYGIKKILHSVVGDKVCIMAQEKDVMKSNMRLCFNELPVLRSLYPWLLLYEKNIILCTATKFLLNLPMLVNPDVILYKAQFLQGSLVVLDESDSVYQDWRDYLLTAPSARTVYSLYNVFNKVCNALTTARNKIPTEYICRDELEKVIENTLARADKLFEKEGMMQNLEIYTVVGEERQRYCMFHSDEFRYLLSTRERRMCVKLDKEANIHKLVMSEEKGQGDGDTGDAENEEHNAGGIYQVAGEMVNILQGVADGVARVVNKRIDILVGKGPERRKKKVVVPEWEEEDVFRKIHMDRSMQDIIDILKRMSSLYVNSSRLPLEEDEYSHYNRGWLVTQLAFDDRVSISDGVLTDLNYLTQNSCAEKVLLYMFRQMSMNVVLMSATAASGSLSTNFNLEYLRAKLAENLVYIPDDILHRYEAALEKFLPDEEERPVRCLSLPKAHFSEDNGMPVKIPDGAELLFPPDMRQVGRKFLKELFNVLLVCLGNEKSVRYYMAQYVNFFKGYKAFNDNPRLMSGLCLCERLPKAAGVDGEILWSERVLLIGAALIDGTLSSPAEYSFFKEPPHMRDKLMFVSSANYDKDVAELVRKWEGGQKCMAVSAYKTVGAGMNLAYRVPEGIRITGKRLPHMKAVPDKELKKDMDCLVLLDITGFRSFNMNGGRADGGESGALSMYQYITHLLALCYCGRWDHFSVRCEISNVIAYRKSTRAETCRGFQVDLNEYRLYKIIQAVGRISRGTIKGSETLIVYDSGLEKSIVAGHKQLAYSFEMKCLHKAACRNLQAAGQVPADAESLASEKYVNIANTARDIYRGHVDAALVHYLSMEEEVSPYVLRVQESLERFRDFVCRHPVFAGYPSAPELSKYINNYVDVGQDFGRYSVKFKENADMVVEKLCSAAAVADTGYISVSEEETYLPWLVRNGLVREWFRQKDIPETWRSGRYMLSPYLALSVYKGVIAEQAFQGIMELGFRISLEKLGGIMYELGDFKVVGSTVMIDVKNYNPESPDFVLQRDILPNIVHKVRKTGMKLVVINMLYRNDGIHIDDRSVENVVFINGLINVATGRLIGRSVDYLLQFIYNHKTMEEQ